MRLKNAGMTVAMTAAIVLVAACAGEQGGTTDKTGEPSVPGGSSAGAGAAQAPAGGADSAGGMQGMAGMQGMSGMSGMGGGNMSEMHSHMTMMEKVSPDSLKTMLPAHRQMVGNMLAQAGAEMRKMNMQSDAAFSALSDSLRQDLVRLPDLTGAELSRSFAEHHGRMMRYMKAHEEMMKNMKM